MSQTQRTLDVKVVTYRSRLWTLRRLRCSSMLHFGSSPRSYAHIIACYFLLFRLISLNFGGTFAPYKLMITLECDISWNDIVFIFGIMLCLMISLLPKCCYIKYSFSKFLEKLLLNYLWNVRYVSKVISINILKLL